MVFTLKKKKKYFLNIFRLFNIIMFNLSSHINYLTIDCGYTEQAI